MSDRPTSVQIFEFVLGLVIGVLFFPILWPLALIGAIAAPQHFGNPVRA